MRGCLGRARISNRPAPLSGAGPSGKRPSRDLRRRSRPGRADPARGPPENYTTPTPIQAQAIPHLLAGRDLLGCAQTGATRTAALALPILHRLSNDVAADRAEGLPRAGADPDVSWRPRSATASPLTAAFSRSATPWSSAASPKASRSAPGARRRRPDRRRVACST